MHGIFFKNEKGNKWQKRGSVLYLSVSMDTTLVSLQLTEECVCLGCVCLCVFDGLCMSACPVICLSSIWLAVQGNTWAPFFLSKNRIKCLTWLALASLIYSFSVYNLFIEYVKNYTYKSVLACWTRVCQL